MLCTIPGVGALTASYYGAALGDRPGSRTPAAYRYSGMANYSRWNDIKK